MRKKSVFAAVFNKRANVGKRLVLALLGKQYGYDGDGWQRACAPYGNPGTFSSVADIDSPESRAKVHAHVARHYRRRRRA